MKTILLYVDWCWTVIGCFFYEFGNHFYTLNISFHDKVCVISTCSPLPILFKNYRIYIKKIKFHLEFILAS